MGGLLVLRRFEFSKGTSNKFWEIGLEGVGLTTRWGRIGTEGQTRVQTLPDTEAAQRELNKQIAAKTKEGYRSIEPEAPLQVRIPEGAGTGERLVFSLDEQRWCTVTAALGEQLETALAAVLANPTRETAQTLNQILAQLGIRVMGVAKSVGVEGSRDQPFLVAHETPDSMLARLRYAGHEELLEAFAQAATANLSANQALSLLERLGERVVSSYLRLLNREPRTFLEALSYCDGPGVGEALLPFLKKNRELRELAQQWLARFPRSAALLALSERPRPGGPEALRWLHEHGFAQLLSELADIPPRLKVLEKALADPKDTPRRPPARR
jgi:predicted DNA-binding WGR domain protein